MEKSVPNPAENRRSIISHCVSSSKQAHRRCRAVFRKHEVSPTCFELEVTETTLMTDPKRTIGC